MSKFLRPHLISSSEYTVPSWNSVFPDGNVHIEKLYINASWKDFFDRPETQKMIKKINRDLTSELSGDADNKRPHKIFPYPDSLFAALNATPLERIKVVIIGQDPYHGMCKNIPQAMGLSFSVPKGTTIPPSLANIYSNLLNYEHVFKTPNHGNLSFWAYQGCLMLNSSLTVREGSPNIHSPIWTPFTDSLIKYISDCTDNIIFVLWGGSSYSKYHLINHKKHKIIVSSHPSPYSFANRFRNFGSFKDTDHFGEINKYLTALNKQPIIWDII